MLFLPSVIVKKFFPHILPCPKVSCLYCQSFIIVFSSSVIVKKIFPHLTTNLSSPALKSKSISKNHSTQDSHVVPHHGTNWAALWLTAQIRRDAVLSGSYGRGCNTYVNSNIYPLHLFFFHYKYSILLLSISNQISFIPNKIVSNLVSQHI